MPEFKITRRIAAPRERVFQWASDFRRAPQFIRAIQRVEVLTDGPVGVGTRFRETRMMFKREATEVLEVTAYDPPDRYALGCESCGCRYHSEFRFRPAAGGTDVELYFRAVPLTFFAKVMGVLMRPMFKACVKACAQDLDDLKAAVEGGGSAVASAPSPAAG